MKRNTTILTIIFLCLVVAGLIGLTIFRGDLRPDLAAAGRLWTTPYFHIGNLAITPALVLQALIFIIILTAVTHVIRSFVRQQILNRTLLDEGQKYAIERATGYFVFALGALIGLQVSGLNLNSLAFLGGALGIGVGFGFQNIASNFASGLILLFERPIKVGDRIEVGNLVGDVTRIGARSTWVQTNDNVIIIVPNADFTSSRVTNWTANDRQVRFSLPVGVSYSADPDRIREILLEIAAAHPDVLHQPPPEVLFSAFGDSSLDFELRVWTITQVQTPGRLKSELYFEIFRRFRKENIEIPFPQRDLHLRSVDVDIPLLQGNSQARPLESEPN